MALSVIGLDFHVNLDAGGASLEAAIRIGDHEFQM